MSDDRQRARDLLRAASHIVVLTGAGVSAESGVPTFRGAGGLWKQFRPEDLATPEAFARDPRLVWEWYATRRDKVLACEPNAAHRAMAAFALSRGTMTIVTQNVDGLHARAARAEAGSADAAAAMPLEVHGSILRDRCSDCDARSDPVPVDASSAATLPRCAHCGGLLRPDVVWFGEMLDPQVLSAADTAAARAEVCLVVGTSALVYPAAALPLRTRERGGAIIEVNPEETAMSHAAAVSIRGSAAGVVPTLLD
ncbi:MAG: NAD-dependent protein deacylase [Gemmatimonadota bacterium]|nr:NAD-dependent protein deacylase [Gemmatimonadota bacterium]